MEHEEGDADALALQGFPRDGLKTILRFLLPTNGEGSKKWRVGQMRLIALAHAAGLEGVANLTQTEIARQMDCSKALISYYCTAVADELKEFSPRGGRTPQARQAYALRATAVHKRLGHAVAGDAV